MTSTFNSTEHAKQVSSTILQQLGGNKFLVMTGAKNLAFDKISKTNKNVSLQMKLPRNNSGANTLKISLMGDDTYTMEFYNGRLCRKTFDFKKSKQQTFERIYNDQLQEIFTQVTGFYTSL